MTTYGRLNDPVAYGDFGDTDETLLEDARANVTVEGMEERFYDFEIVRDAAHDDAVVYLFTLFKADPSDPDGRLSLPEGHGSGTIDVECGDEEYFSHVMDERAVEDDHVFSK